MTEEAAAAEAGEAGAGQDSVGAATTTTPASAASGTLAADSVKQGIQRAEGAADGAEAATFFSLEPAETFFCGSFPCSLGGTRGHVYVFEFAIAFAAENLTSDNKWSTPAQVVNNLEIDGPTTLEITLATGSKVGLLRVSAYNSV